MIYVVEGFGEFLPYVFMLCVVGIIWNSVINAFVGGKLT